MSSSLIFRVSHGIDSGRIYKLSVPKKSNDEAEIAQRYIEFIESIDGGDEFVW